MKNIKFITLILSLTLSGICFSQIKPNKVWTEYTSFQGVKIEFKFTKCTPDENREQILVLFRYTNTTQDKVELSWKSEVWRNNVCTNCTSTSTEHDKSLVLNPSQVIEADGASKKIKTHYLFGNFTNLVPGMTDQKLTDFKFQNLTKKIL